MNIGIGIRLGSISVRGTAATPPAPITTSKAFNSSGVQVGDTITGAIPENWVANEATVTSVIFANDNSVTSIGVYAFGFCTALTTITIPNSVTSIGDFAFRGTPLTSITIPNAVTNIGSEAFYECSSLSSLTFAPTSSLAIIGGTAFRSCGLTSITIPNSVTDIGVSAFRQNPFTTVTLGTGLITIAESAFQSCSSLTSITIPNNVTSIGIYAFRGCTNLATATIGTGVTSIGGYAFEGCVSLTSVSIPNSVTSIGGYAFQQCTSLATVTCRVAQSAFTGSNAFYNTASPLVIQARITDDSWTAGTGLTFQGNTNVTVIKNL